MSQPGRNDPCPCGSGKKYKKCCTPQYDKPVPVMNTAKSKLTLLPSGDMDLMMPKYSRHLGGPARREFADLSRVPVPKILSRLKELGIEMDEPVFVELLRETRDAVRIARQWEDCVGHRLSSNERDYLYDAAFELSMTCAIYIDSIDKLEKRVDLLASSQKRWDFMLDDYRMVWTKLKESFILPQGFRSFQQLQDEYDTFYDYEMVILDYEGILRDTA